MRSQNDKDQIDDERLAGTRGHQAGVYGRSQTAGSFFEASP